MKLCKKNGCSCYAAPERKYCFNHFFLEGEPELDGKDHAIDKFNPYGFRNQVELFRWCWETRMHKCYVTGQNLDGFDETSMFPSVFAHVIRKSAFNRFRLYPNNIAMVSPNYKGYSIHHLFDNAVFDKIIQFEDETGKSFRILFELEDIVYKEYKREIGTTTPPRKIVEKYLNKRG
jgi:hypothetical protein